jgi:hypothetical protein
MTAVIMQIGYTPATLGGLHRHCNKLKSTQQRTFAIGSVLAFCLEVIESLLVANLVSLPRKIARKNSVRDFVAHYVLFSFFAMMALIAS